VIGTEFRVKWFVYSTVDASTSSIDWWALMYSHLK